MKQETIEQLLQIAGKQEYTQTMSLSVSQVNAMLEAAYEAGQRDLSFMGKPERTDGLPSNYGQCIASGDIWGPFKKELV